MRIGSSDELPNPGPHVALHTLLLTEHEPAVAKPLIDDAAARGIDVHWYHDGAAALLAVGAELPTLVVLAAGPLRVDRLAHAVWLHGRELALSHREFELLAYLLEQNGRIVGQEMISQAVWGHSTETNTVAVHVKRLREKLGTDPQHGQIIRTIRGLGYGLAPSLYQPEVPIQP